MAKGIKADIKSYFGTIKDPRKHHSPPHNFMELIIVALCGVICGADSWEMIEEYGKTQEEWLKKKLGLRLSNGIASHDTLGRVFSLINPQELKESFANWVESIREVIGRERVSIDGKKSKRSYDKWTGKKALHLVSAWASEAGLVLGQEKTEDKSNEITAIPILLEMLVLKGCIVTIDAMGCQTEIAHKIVEQEADYILALKKNQKDLYQETQATFEECLKSDFAQVDFDFAQTIEKSHGRIETRRCWVINDPQIIAYLDPQAKWTNFKSIILLQSQRRIGSKVSTQTRYFISSLSGNAKIINRAIRLHWGIENKLHWVLDVVFRDDYSRIRQGHAPQNFAILRHLALNLLRRHNGVGSIRSKRFKAALKPSFLLDILSNFT